MLKFEEKKSVARRLNFGVLECYCLISSADKKSFNQSGCFGSFVPLSILLAYFEQGKTFGLYRNFKCMEPNRPKDGVSSDITQLCFVLQGTFCSIHKAAN